MFPSFDITCHFSLLFFRLFLICLQLSFSCLFYTLSVSHPFMSRLLSLSPDLFSGDVRPDHDDDHCTKESLFRFPGPFHSISLTVFLFDIFILAKLRDIRQGNRETSKEATQEERRVEDVTESYTMQFERKEMQPETTFFFLFLFPSSSSSCTSTASTSFSSFSSSSFLSLDFDRDSCFHLFLLFL